MEAQELCHEFSTEYTSQPTCQRFKMIHLLTFSSKNFLNTDESGILKTYSISLLMTNSLRKKSVYM